MADRDGDFERRREAELEPFRKYAAATDSNERDAIRNEIFTKYVGIVNACCSRYAGTGGLEWGDIYAAASLALLKAIENFNPDYGNGFTVFAIATVTGEVQNFCRDNGTGLRPPRDVSSTARRVKNASDGYYVEHGEYPTVQELSEILHMKEEKIQEAMEYKSPTSLDIELKEGAEDGEGDGKTLIDVLVGDDRADRADLLIALEDEIEKLSAPEKKVIRGIYFENKTQTQLAAEMGTSQMFVSRTAKRALENLRKALNG